MPPLSAFLNNVRIGADGYRAEVFYNGQWGTICDDDFNDHDGRVFCRSLGYSFVRVASNDEVQDGTLQTLAADLHCTGQEENVAECPGTWGQGHNCRHNEDVGVVCGGALQ